MALALRATAQLTRGERVMSVQLETRPTAPGSDTRAAEFDLDAVDRALDQGDLETVRCLLGVSREAWRLMLRSL
jgi:hypothetical protein